MTIAITGSTGHLATSVIPLLINKGYRVRALQHERAPFGDLTTLETVKGSLSDLASLNKLVWGCDVVIHCAAKISINSNSDLSVYETNVNGTVNTFTAARQAGVKRFIHISSIHAYDQLPKDELLTETRQYCSNKAPRYDQSKRDAEKFVLQKASDHMEVVVLNPTAVVGPLDYRPSLLGKAIMDMYNGKVPALIDGGFDFCDVRDVALGIVNAIEKGRSGQSYLLSGKWHGLADLQQIIMRIKGDKRSIPVLPARAAYLGLPFVRLLAAVKRQEPLYTKESLYAVIQGNKNVHSAKAAEALGYTCRPLRETIADSINWFKQVGYLA